MYACPNCGGNMKFHIPSQQLACDYCQTQADPYTFEDKAETSLSKQEYEVTVFTCPQCGGEIVSTDTSAAEFCTFCGASTILHSRLRNEKRPTHIIPFRKTKEDCKAAYSAMMKKAPFAPDALKNPKYIDSFRGIYMPYWTFHVTQNSSFNFNGSRSHRHGDYILTDNFACKGDLEASFDGLSYDASSSFDDNISEKIAPYDVKEMKSFTPAFLSGFYADTADVDSSTYEQDAYAAASEVSLDAIYDRPVFADLSKKKTLSASDLNSETEDIESAMFPVWFLSYRNGGRVAYATVNGQTGKVVTDLPVDVRKYTKCSLLLALPIFLFLNLFFTMMPKTLLIISLILTGVSAVIFAMERTKLRLKESGVSDKGSKAKLSKAAQKLPEEKKHQGLRVLIPAIVIGIAILILNPVNDLFYYAGVVLILSAVFRGIKDIMFYYNMLATRRLPQFDKTGGDDRA